MFSNSNDRLVGTLKLLLLLGLILFSMYVLGRVQDFDKKGLELTSKIKLQHAQYVQLGVNMI